jgi:hypothetical protein
MLGNAPELCRDCWRENGKVASSGQRLAEAKSRLDLSEQQATTMAPILKKNMHESIDL